MKYSVIVLWREVHEEALAEKKTEIFWKNDLRFVCVCVWWRAGGKEHETVFPNFVD